MKKEKGDVDIEHLTYLIHFFFSEPCSVREKSGHMHMRAIPNRQSDDDESILGGTKQKTHERRTDLLIGFSV